MTPDQMRAAARAAAARELRLGDADGFAAVSHAIDNIAMSWMGPVFFVTLGTKLVSQSFSSHPSLSLTWRA